MNRQLFEYHPAIGYRFIPGVKARVDHEGGGYLLRVNDCGFRCSHDVIPEKKPGTFRILLFGDSYTAGDGVSNKHRYGDLLEADVPGLEIINFALSGTGTDQHYLIFQEFAREIEHDLIIVAVLVENIRRVAAHYRPFLNEDGEEHILAKPYFELTESGALELHHVPCPRDPISSEGLAGEEQQFLDQGGRLQWARALVNRLGPTAKEWSQRLTRYQPLPEYDSPSNPTWRVMKQILLQWKSEVDTPFLVMPIPLYHYIEKTASPKAYRARFRELGAEGKLEIHDPLDDFLAHSAVDRRNFRFEHDCHLTPSAHRVLADSLRERLQTFLPPQPSDASDPAGRPARA